jgi:CO dehydrogenase maturation factor
LSPELERAIEQNGLELLAVLPDDPLVAEFDAVGRPLVQLPADSALSGALEPLVATLLSHTRGKEATGAHHR